MGKEETKDTSANKGGHAALPAFEGIRPGSVPGAGAAFALMARLGITRAVRGKLLYASLAILAFPLLIQVLIMVSGQGVGPRRFTSLAVMWLNAVLPLSVILAGYGAVADEVESKTLGYLFCRPVPRWCLPLGKAVTPVALLGPFTCVLASVGWAMAGAHDSPVPLLSGVIIGAVYYAAVAVCGGAIVPKHGVVASLAYVAVTDLALGVIPGFTQALSPGYHIRNIAGLLPPPTALQRFLPRPEISVPTSVVVVLVVSAVLMGITVLRISAREYRTTP